jgi:hypothetical protein
MASRRKSTLALLIATIFLCSIHGGGNRRAVATLLKQYTFNTAVSDSDCTLYGADSSDANHDCESTGNPAEGDARFLYFNTGSGTYTTDWNDDWTGETDGVTWVKFHMLIADLGVSGAETIGFRTTGGALIGSNGYSIQYVRETDNKLRIHCGNGTADWVNAFTYATWHEYEVQLDLPNAAVHVYQDGDIGGGTPTKSCDSVGDHTASVVNSLRIQTFKTGGIIGEDDIRIYDSRP